MGQPLLLALSCWITIKCNFNASANIIVYVRAEVGGRSGNFTEAVIIFGNTTTTTTNHKNWNNSANTISEDNTI